MDTRPTWSSSGAGPAGSAAAAWAARAGRDVLVIDSAQFPRDKACGDGLTPRAVAELELLGLGPWLDGRIRHRGLRMSGFGARGRDRLAGPVVPVDRQRGAAHRARRPHPGGRGRRGREDAVGRESRWCAA